MTPLQQTFTALVRSVQQSQDESNRRSTEARRAQGARMKAERDERKADALRFVRENPGVTVNDVAEHFGLGRSVTGNYMLELKREGHIIGEREKRNELERFYEVV